MLRTLDSLILVSSPFPLYSPCPTPLLPCRWQKRLEKLLCIINNLKVNGRGGRTETRGKVQRGWWKKVWHLKTVFLLPNPDKILKLTNRFQTCEQMLSHAISSLWWVWELCKARDSWAYLHHHGIPQSRWLIQLKWLNREPGPQSGSRVGWDCQPMCSGLLCSSVLSPWWSSIAIQITSTYVISPSTQVSFGSSNIFKIADLKFWLISQRSDLP